jgi:hypothetical protein
MLEAILNYEQMGIFGFGKKEKDNQAVPINIF